MPLVSFTLHQTTESVEGPLYRVTNTVTAATNASTSVFVYKTLNKKFDHYAVAADMESWPDTYEAAVQADSQFYRLSTVTRDWTSVQAMKQDLTVTKQRIQLLASDLSKLQDGIVIDETTVISAGE